MAEKYTELSEIGDTEKRHHVTKTKKGEGESENDVFNTEGEKRFGMLLSDSSSSSEDDHYCRPKDTLLLKVDMNTQASSETVTCVSCLAYFGDITNAQTEGIAIVSDFYLRMSSTIVGKQLRKKAGNQFKKECKALKQAKKQTDSFPPFKLFDVVHTCAGGKLHPDVRYIIHTFLPRYTGKTAASYLYCLSDVYLSIFTYANKLGLLSLSLPILGTGKVGVPLDVSVDAFVSGFKSYRSREGPKNLCDIHLVNMDSDTVEKVQRVITKETHPDDRSRAGSFTHYGLRQAPLEWSVEISDSLNLQFLTSDILSINCDAIAILTNKDLKLVSGIAKMVERKAGPAFNRECEKIRKSKGELQVCDIVQVRAVNLRPVKTVIMIVMERFDTNSVSDEQRSHLIDLYEKIFHCANSSGLKSVGMTLLGIGAANIPQTICVAALHKAANAFSQNRGKDTTLRNIVIVNTDEEITNPCFQLFSQLNAFGEKDVLGIGLDTM